VDPLGSAEHTVGTTALGCVTVARIRYTKHMLISWKRCCEGPGEKD
jgi:hypothetical protein